MRLFEVIDEEQAEQMLEQHDRYEFGVIAVVRRENEWLVYWRIWEAHFFLDNSSGVRPYDSLAEALEFALSPRTQEMLVEAEKDRAGTPCD